MDNLEGTVVVGRESVKMISDLRVTVFDGTATPRTFQLDHFQKSMVSFGRAEGNDILLSSPFVSREHGRIRYENRKWIIEDKAVYGARPSENGLYCNNMRIASRILCEGDFIRIDDGTGTNPNGVLLVFESQNSENRWSGFPLRGQSMIMIGRDPGNDIVLPHVSISRVHARIIREGNAYYIADNYSTNGVYVNNYPVRGRQLLHEKDVILITNSRLIFTGAGIYYCCCRSGISVDTTDVVITRGRGRKKNITGDHITVNIRPGEMVAIVGGSGAGKSTILNCMCGYLPPADGSVYINGVNLYKNFDSLKKIIGYVPQQDIVFDNLKLRDMLSYTAKLRLPRDTSKAEREAAIDRAISLVELSEKKNSYIKSLSGGQRKRASIAVELLSDPNLLFLDEPASGLDPGTERSLMQSLRKMTDNGKTVILVTHSTLQLEMCDRVMFMGKGGKLCFIGSCAEAREFFGVSDIVDIYSMITDHADFWQRKYNTTIARPGRSTAQPGKLPKKKKRGKRQLPILSSRYRKLVMNDRARLFLLLIQAPVLALLISMVADGKQFEQHEMTKSLLFALSCSGFWVGMLNAIQEICKERNITKREYMTGLSLNAYLMSKIIVLGALCLIQSGMIVGVFAATVGLPEKGLFMEPVLELLITTFLTSIASTAMGLFVSSLFTNPDRAMTVAPILLMPQILFSGLIFELSGATKTISWFAVCRWSMEGYGTTANLSKLKMAAEEFGISRDILLKDKDMSFFEYTDTHMLITWGILIGFVVGFLILARIVLGRIGKEKG